MKTINMKYTEYVERMHGVANVSFQMIQPRNLHSSSLEISHISSDNMLSVLRRLSQFILELYTYNISNLLTTG